MILVMNDETFAL